MFYNIKLASSLRYSQTGDMPILIIHIVSLIISLLY